MQLSSLYGPVPKLGPWLYNRAALERFYAARYLSGLYKSAALYGGLDVVVAGDSLVAGDGNPNNEMNFLGWVDIGRDLVQQALNPVAMANSYGLNLGGHGCQQIWNGTNWFTPDGTYRTFNGGFAPTTTAKTGNGLGGNSIVFPVQGGGTANAGVYLQVDLFGNGVVAASLVRNHTNWSLVYTGGPAQATLFGSENNSGAAQGEIDGSYLPVTNPATLTFGYQDAVRSISNPTNPSHNYITVGTKDNTYPAQPDALVLFQNDTDQGIRVHKIGTPSLLLTQWTSDALQATFDSWCQVPDGTTGFTGASNCKLVVIEPFINDYGGGEAVATFEAAYTTIIQRIQTAANCPSKPAILLVIPMKQNIVSPYTEANFQMFREAVYALASTYDCAVLDFWAAMGYTDWGGTWTANGFNNADGVHPSTAGHEWMGSLFADVLIAAA